MQTFLERTQRCLLTAAPLFQVCRSGWGAGRLRMEGRKGAALFSNASPLGFAETLLSLPLAATHYHTILRKWTLPSWTLRRSKQMQQLQPDCLAKHRLPATVLGTGYQNLQASQVWIILACEKWRQEGREFQVIISFLLSSRPAWATGDPAWNKQTNEKPIKHGLGRLSLKLTWD